MSATKLTRLERAVLRNVQWGRACWDGRTEAGKLATITGCVYALERLRKYGFVAQAWNVLTPRGREVLR
jgi:hypothetical protein